MFDAPSNLRRRQSAHRGAHRTYEIKATGEAAKNYDFISARAPGKRTTVIESIGHLVKSCLGGGVVAIHESYKQCGLWTSLFLTILFGLFVSYLMLMLARSAQKIYGRVQVPAMSYPDLAEAALMTSPFVKLRKYSRCFRYAVDFTICADLFGSCCVYQIMISRTIKQLIENTDEITSEGNPPLRVYIATLLIPCVLICMITSLKYLAPFSIVADAIIVLVAGSTVFYAVIMSEKSPLEFPVFKTVAGLFEFMGVCVFSMEGVGVTLAIENSMEDPKKIPIVLAGGMSIVVSIVLTVGFFGYWGFGEKSKSPVTVNFPLTPYPIVLKLLMALMIYVTFALNFWIPFDLVWYYIKQRYDPSKYWLWERVYRGMFVVIITTIAVTFPSVTKFIGLLGSFCLSNMGFIYPAFIELCLDWNDPGLGIMMWRLWKFVFILIFGTILCIVGTYSNAKELIKETRFEKDDSRTSRSASHRGHHKFEIKATGEAARNYDFKAARTPKKRTNSIETIGNLAKSCLGGGVVAIHESYKMCGLWTSLFLTIVFGFCISYAMFTIADSAQRMYGRVQVPQMSYPDLAEATLETGPFPKLKKYSKCFRYLVDFTICFNLFGSCCVYQIMMARTIKQLVEGTNEISMEGDPPLRVYIVVLIIPCILLGMITSLKYLAPFSIVADFIIMTVALATVYYAVKSAETSPKDMPVFKTVSGLFEFMGVCIFSMEGLGAVMAIENNMEEPRKMGVALFGGMSIVVSITITIGFFGYWGFGEDSKSPVTLNFPLEPFPIFARVLLGLMIYVTFALNFFFPFDLMWFYIKVKYDPSKYWFWERVYRAGFICIITVIATTFPNVSKFLGLLGSFCVSNMGFIYPAFIELCLDWTDPGLGVMMWRLWKFVLTVSFGLILCIIGTYTNTRARVKTTPGRPNWLYPNSTKKHAPPKKSGALALATTSDHSRSATAAARGQR